MSPANRRRRLSGSDFCFVPRFGLLAYAMRSLGIGWQVTWGLGLVPTILYGIQAFSVTFPKTERSASGISAGEMVKAASATTLRSPPIQSGREP